MFICPHCKKTNAVKVGLRKNKSGFVQKYFCNDCKTYFVDRKGFENCQTKPEIIVEALDLRAKGMSLGKIVMHLNQKYKTSITRSSVLKWQNKFGEMINHFTSSFQLSHSLDAHADEVFLRKKGHRNDNFIYYWDVIDYETKFLIADHISYERNEDEGKKFMRNLKNAIPLGPVRLHTDNSYDYPMSITWVFGRNNVEHVHFPARKKKFKNNPIERFHNTLKENYKVMRKFVNIITAKKYLDFFRNYYNFLRLHKSLSWQTPAQRAGFGRWNWYSLIRAVLIRHQLNC
jgi:transposase-like protein